MTKLADELIRLQTQVKEQSALFEKNKSSFDRTAHETRTRSKIAEIFVKAFFILIAATLLATMTYNIIVLKLCPAGVDCSSMQLGIQDMLMAVAGYIGSPLGFVIGYYFKGKEE